MRLLRFVRNVASPNRDRRLAALKIVADWLIPDYRLTWWQMDWWNDEAFNAFLDRFDQRQRFSTHRRWMVHQLLKLIRDVPGDTAECGVWLGTTSWLIAQSGRRHHAFDSFEGLSEPTTADGAYWAKGSLTAPEEIVRRNLDGLNVELYKGWIPERFDDVADRQFAFVHIDVDLYQPTRDSIEFFYPRMPSGAVLVCDDYACSTCPGATKAIDEFMADKPEPVIAMDAGGGFFIKR